MTRAAATDVEPVVEPPVKASRFKRVLEARAKPLPRRAQLIVTIVLFVFLVVASVWAWRRSWA